MGGAKIKRNLMKGATVPRRRIKSKSISTDDGELSPIHPIQTPSPKPQISIYPPVQKTI
jgi:hypothetical protein